MAKMPALLDLLASFGGADRTTIEGQSRSLRADGLMSQGKRGLGSPEVTHADAAALMLAGMCTNSPLSAPKSVREVLELRPGIPRTANGLPADVAHLAKSLRELVNPLQAMMVLVREMPGIEKGTLRLKASLDKAAGSFTVVGAGPDGKPAIRFHWGSGGDAMPEDEEPMWTSTASLSGAAFSRVGQLVSPVRRDIGSPDGVAYIENRGSRFLGGKLDTELRRFFSTQWSGRGSGTVPKAVSDPIPCYGIDPEDLGKPDPLDHAKFIGFSMVLVESHGSLGSLSVMDQAGRPRVLAYTQGRVASLHKALAAAREIHADADLRWLGQDGNAAVWMPEIGDALIPTIKGGEFVRNPSVDPDFLDRLAASPPTP